MTCTRDRRHAPHPPWQPHPTPTDSHPPSCHSETSISEKGRVDVLLQRDLHYPWSTRHIVHPLMRHRRRHTVCQTSLCASPSPPNTICNDTLLVTSWHLKQAESSQNIVSYLSIAFVIGIILPMFYPPLITHAWPKPGIHNISPFLSTCAIYFCRYLTSSTSCDLVSSSSWSSGGLSTCSKMGIRVGVAC